MLNGETIRLDGAIRMAAAVTAEHRPSRAAGPDARSKASLVVTINRPDARNAINTAAAQGDRRGDGRARRRETDLVAGVITGAGGTFCTGMDLKAFLAGERPPCRAAGSPASSSDRRPSRSSPRSRATPSPAASRSRWPAT